MLSLSKAIGEVIERLDARRAGRRVTGMAIERWKEDREAFKKHFDISYEDFTKLISALNPGQAAKYEKILGTHEEAAILWAIHEGKSHGLLKEIPDQPTEPSLNQTVVCGECRAINDADATECRKCGVEFEESE